MSLLEHFVTGNVLFAIWNLRDSVFLLGAFSFEGKMPDSYSDIFILQTTDTDRSTFYRNY